MIFSERLRLSNLRNADDVFPALQLFLVPCRGLLSQNAAAALLREINEQYEVLLTLWMGFATCTNLNLGW